MNASRTMTADRRENLIALPFFAFLDTSADLFATVILVVVALILMALSFIFAARRSSPNHDYMLDLLLRLREPDVSSMPASTSEAQLSRRMRA